MGLAGGSHCLAMCSAPCAAVLGAGGARGPATGAGQVAVQWAPSKGQAVQRAVAFHAGRLAGYSAAGAAAAFAMDSLAWITQQAWALRPVWTMMHVAVMAWGLMMLLQARQPAWIEQAGRAVWARFGPLVRAPGGVAAAGLVWAGMPCGLLYSALLVAGLSGSALQGAFAMLLFGVGSGVWLLAGPWAWTRLKRRLDAARAQWGTRIAGGLLMGVASWALWMDLVYKPSLWCR